MLIALTNNLRLSSTFSFGFYKIETQMKSNQSNQAGIKKLY